MMNYFNRAIKSITRKPGKSLLLLLMVFILGTIITGAIAVENAVNNTEENLRNGMRPLITFEHDILALTVDNNTIRSPEPITAEIARQIAELPQVSQHHYMVGAHLQTQQFKNYFSNSEQPMDDNLLNQFTLQGGSTTIPMPFNEGMLELVAGDYFSEEELTKQIIISQQLATVNGLQLGSVVELEIVVWRPQPSRFGLGTWEEDWHLNPENVYATEVFTLEVVGIFEFPLVETDEPLNLLEQVLVNRQRDWTLNTIFMTNDTAEQIRIFQRTNYLSAMEDLLAKHGMVIDDVVGRDFTETSFESVMELYDARAIEDFKLLAYELLPDDWVITDLSNSFASITSSMDTLQEIGRLILLISIGATILILSLLITLYLHDRRCEIGIYSALGEKKFKTVLQLLIEIMVVAVVGMALAVFTGSILSESMSRFMIQNELTAPQNTEVNLALDRFGFHQAMSVSDMLESFEMSLDIATVGLFFGIGIAVVTLSTIIPVIYIVSLKPKKILLKS